MAWLVFPCWENKRVTLYRNLFFAEYNKKGIAIVTLTNGCKVRGAKRSGRPKMIDRPVNILEIAESMIYGLATKSTSARSSCRVITRGLFVKTYLLLLTLRT
jgi:hypothetical protein